MKYKKSHIYINMRGYIDGMRLRLQEMMMKNANKNIACKNKG